MGESRSSTAESSRVCVHPALLGATVGHQRRVELFRAALGGAPLEEADRVGTACDVTENGAEQLAVSLCVVDRLPTDGARRHLHDHPRVAARNATRQICAEGKLGKRVGQPVVEVVVIGNDIEVACPPEVVLAW